ncbi:MAG: CHASE2 domain-containing protein, partial [Saprospiraceae bacterium]|nr:CHASE2 domain-containing protein [Saprospiraceae bacterium]
LARGLYDQLITEQYHVLHFIGHGGFAGEVPFLQVNAPAGGTDRLPWNQFARLLQNQVDVKLIVLNSCEGATLSSGQSHVGMAPKLVEAGIPAVIAMQFAIYDQAAIKFADKFYRSLFKGWARGRVDVAMTHARIALDSAFPNDPALGTPVLFMRAPEGILFDLSTRKPVLQMPMGSKFQASEKTMAKTYQWNIDLLKKSHQASPDEALQQDLQRQSQELKRIRKQIKLRRYSVTAASAMALIVFFMSWIQLFDVLTLDSRVESLTMWMGDQFRHKTFDEDIRILAIDTVTHADLDTTAFGPVYRKHHAALIDSLSKHRAKVVAFDVYFNEQHTYDDTLAAAIRRAQERGTGVILGIQEMRNNAPRIPPVLRTEIQNGNLHFATLCVGRRLGLATSAPLVLQRQHVLYPSLPLQAFMLYHGGTLQDIDFNSREVDLLESGAAGHPHTQRIGFSSFDTVSNTQVACPVMQVGDTIVSTLVDLTPLHLIRAQTTPYQEVLQGANLDSFANKIVLVGVQEGNRDDFATRAERRRYGVEFHADTINTLMRQVTIRPLGTTGQIIVTILMALLGAVVRYRWSRRRT